MEGLGSGPLPGPEGKLKSFYEKRAIPRPVPRLFATWAQSQGWQFLPGALLPVTWTRSVTAETEFGPQS